MTKKRRVVKLGDLKGIDDKVVEWVPVSEWSEILGCQEDEEAGVYVRSISSGADDVLQDSMLKIVDAVDDKTGKPILDEQGDPKKEVHQTLVNITAKWCAATICDENGVLIYGPDDVAWLTELAPLGLNKVYVVARRLAGKNDEELAKQVKNG